MTGDIDSINTFFAKSILDIADINLVNSFTNILLPNLGGSILITTRNKLVSGRLAGRNAYVEVLAMSLEEAGDLLKSHLAQPDNWNNDESKILLEELERLSFAITQAADFIRERSTTLSECIKILHADDADIRCLLDEDLGDLRRDSESQNSVIRTWKLSLGLISKQKPHAAKTTSIMSGLYWQRIPKDSI